MKEKEMDKGKLEAKVYSFEELLDEKGQVVYTIVGYSMTPFLRPRRDLVVIRKRGTGRYKKYDVVLYKRNDQYVLHRILKVYPSGYLIAGDHNTFVETDITDKAIIGVMESVIRDGKTITPNNWKYKAYVHLWCDFYPVRFFLLKLKAFAYRCISFVKRRVLGK